MVGMGDCRVHLALTPLAAPSPTTLTAEPTRTPTRWLVFGALILVQVSFGVNYLASKVAMRELEPQALATLRVVIGAVCLLVIAQLAGGRWPRNPRTYLELALYSLFGVVLNQILFIEGLHRTTPTHSSLIVATIPVLTLVIAILMRREAFTGRKALAPLLAILGVLLIVQPSGSSLGSSTALGDLFTFGNGVSFAFFLVISKRLLTREAPLPATAVLMTFGAISICGFGLPEVLATDFGSLSTLTWWLIAYIAVFPTALAYWLQYWALARIESSVVAFFIYLQPVIATSLSVWLLDEQLDALVLSGGALIFLGVWLTIRR